MSESDPLGCLVGPCLLDLGEGFNCVLSHAITLVSVNKGRVERWIHAQKHDVKLASMPPSGPGPVK